MNPPHGVTTGDGISIIDLHPPTDVVDSYYEVARAMERRDKQINDAIKDATKKIKDNEGKVMEILADARATSEEKLQEADKDRKRFEALYLARKEHRELVDFQVYWNSVSKSLSGRELLLIDSDKVGVKRNLMLFDPEQFRVPVPIIVRPDPEVRPPFRPKDEH